MDGDGKARGARIDFFDGDRLVGGVCFLKTKKEEKARGARIDFFDEDGLVGGICFPPMSEGRKGEGAAIDFFDGDGLVGGVCFLKTEKEEKARGAQILFPAGRVGAYCIRPLIRTPEGDEGSTHSQTFPAGMIGGRMQYAPTSVPLTGNATGYRITT